MSRQTVIRAGELRHVVQIVSLPSQQDSFGGPIQSDAAVFASVRGSVRALSGRELYSAQQMVSEVTHKVTVRWLPGVKAKMDVAFSAGSPAVTRYFQILYVLNPDELNKLLVLLCIERDDGYALGV